MYRPHEDPPWEEDATKGERLSNTPKWARERKWLLEVAKTPERDLRGHRITLTYHALAIDLYQWIYDVQGPVSTRRHSRADSVGQRQLVQLLDVGDGNAERRHPQRRSAVSQ